MDYFITYVEQYDLGWAPIGFLYPQESQKYYKYPMGYHMILEKNCSDPDSLGKLKSILKIKESSINYSLILNNYWVSGLNIGFGQPVELIVITWIA